VHITVYCPRCNGEYRVEYYMRGKRMRCPNPVCRETFVVQEVSEPPPADADAPPASGEEVYGFKPENAPLPPPGRMSADAVHFTGNLGEMVPIEGAELVEGEDGNPPGRQVEDVVPLLSAEIVPENLPPEPTEATPWDVPPPVRNPHAPPTEPEPPRAAPKTMQARSAPGRAGSETVVTRKTRTPPTGESEAIRAPETVLASPPAPAEIPPGPVEMPPGAWEAPPVRRPAEPTVQEPAPPEPVAAEHGEELTPATGRHGALIVAVIAVGVLLLAVGAGFFLFNYFAQSEDRLFQQALQEYNQRNWNAAADRFRQIVKQYPTSEKLPIYEFFLDLSETRDAVDAVAEPDVGYARLNQFLEKHRAGPILGKDKERRADVWDSYLKLVEKFSADAATNKKRGQIALAEEALGASGEYDPRTGDSAVQRMKATEQIQQANKALDRWDRLQTVLARGEDLLKAGPTVAAVRHWFIVATHMGFGSEVTELHQRLNDAVRGQIKWVPEATQLGHETADVFEPSLQVVPLVGGPSNLPPGRDRVVPTVSTGVLHALAQGSGDVVWSTRVGIDTTTLPVLLPATPTTPEPLFLVVSAENNTLRALVARTGTELWRYKLPAPCLGRPLVVKGRAYVPTFDGKVHEIEIFQGNRLGYFELGQPLTVGGAWQPDTDLLYFPGDSENIYVLDREQQKCVSILHSGHPSRALRSAPIVVNRVDPRVRPGDAKGPLPGYLILSQVDGFDHIKLRVFHLPIEQPNQAPALTPEPQVSGWSWFQPYHDPEKLAVTTDAGVFNLYGINQVRNDDPPLFPSLQQQWQVGQTTSTPGRAQVVHADEDDFWILARGQLQRLHYNWYKQQVAPLWDRALDLGSPLHAGQLDETGNTLFVVTQASRPRANLATAVSAAEGRILWQRQLGLDCSSDPVALGRDLLALDRTGAVFAFDPAEHAGPVKPWRKGGRRVAEPLDLGTTPPLLLAGPDGKSVYEIASVGEGRRIEVRRFEAGNAKPTSWMRELIAPLGGTPALGVNYIVLPLANGRLARLPIIGGPAEYAVDWRSNRADENAPGFVVHLGGDQFLFTDGLRGLSQLDWAGAIFENQRTIELPARIVTPPVVLRRADPKAPLQICAATVGERLQLLDADKLEVRRSWLLKGEVTAGPFLRGQHVGCVVGRRNLVWIDPAQEKTLWSCDVPGDGIVGQPQVVEGMVVVADLAGNFIGLDPNTGKPRGKGYTLKASAAPTATPVAYGRGWAFVPLTDGTVFLLALPRLGWLPPGLPAVQLL
jgi:outer membrane protein assembly factor BamB